MHHNTLKRLLTISTRQAFISIALLLASLANNSAGAENDIFTMSLRELTSMEVSVASKYKTSVNVAPAAVTAYQTTDIQQLGYFTLAELSDITAGYGSNQLFAEKGFVTRGQSGSSFDNLRHLVLVDGIPVNHIRSNKAPVDYELPLYFAKSVELLRGPASSLYGVGAFYGVVNITPFASEDGNSIFVSQQQYRDGRRVMVNASNDSNHGVSRLAASHWQISPSASAVGIKNSAENPDHLYWDDQNSQFIFADYALTTGQFKGLSLGSIYMSRDSGIGEYWAGNYSSQGNTLHWETWVPYLKYERSLKENLRIKSYLKSNFSRDAGEFVPVPASTDIDLTSTDTLAFASYDLQYENYEGLLETYFDSSNGWHFIGGINLDSRKQIGGTSSYEDLLISINQDRIDLTIGGENSNPLQDSNSLITRSLYAQLNKRFDVLAGFHFVGGFRYDNSLFKNDENSQTSPRIAFIQELTPQLSMKLIWGNALRSPSVKESTINALVEEKEGFAPSLKPETYEMLEFNVSWQSTHFYASASIFDNQTKDVIFRDWDALGAPYDNLNGEQKSDGYELEIKYLPNNRLNLWANVTNGDSRNELGTPNAGIASSTINIGGQFQMNKITGSLVRKHITGYTTHNTNDELSGHSIVDANFIYRLNKDINLHLTAKNILNEEYYLMSGDTQNIRGDLRSVLLGFEIRL